MDGNVQSIPMIRENGEKMAQFPQKKKGDDNIRNNNGYKGFVD